MKERPCASFAVRIAQEVSSNSNNQHQQSTYELLIQCHKLAGDGVVEWQFSCPNAEVYSIGQTIMKRYVQQYCLTCERGRLQFLKEFLSMPIPKSV